MIRKSVVENKSSNGLNLGTVCNSGSKRYDAHVTVLLFCSPPILSSPSLWMVQEQGKFFVWFWLCILNWSFFIHQTLIWWLTAPGTGEWRWTDKGKILFYFFLLSDGEKPSWPSSTLQIPTNSNSCIYFTCDFMLQLIVQMDVFGDLCSIPESSARDTLSKNQSSLMVVSSSGLIRLNESRVFMSPGDM